MKYRLHIFFLTTYYLLLVTFSYAQNTKTLFETGNSYYQNKQYAEAAKMYELVLQKDKQNFNTLYNLGNAYYHLQQYPEAILYYEKAKKINPDNKYVLQNIALTNNKIFSKIEFSKEFFVTQKIKNLTHSKSSDAWSKYMLCFFWISVITLCIHFFYGKSVLFKIGLFAIIVSIIFAILSYTTYKNEQVQTFAIIIKNDANLKTKPVKDQVGTTNIPAGTKIQIIDNDKNWYKIKLPNDKVGWIENSVISLI